MSGFRILPTAEAELDDIWLYVARDSRSIDMANRLIDALTERVFLAGRTSAAWTAARSRFTPRLAQFPRG